MTLVAVAAVLVLLLVAHRLNKIFRCLRAFLLIMAADRGVDLSEFRSK